MKILFLAEGVSLAHIGRPLTLAEWAYQNNHEVHFACSLEGLAKAGLISINFATHRLTSIKSSTFYERVNQGKFFYQFEEMKEYVEEEIRLINQINPDLIVSDFRLTASISTKLCGKKLLNLSNSHWSPNAECPFPAPSISIFKWLPALIGKSFFNCIRPIAFKVFGHELNRLRKHYGLDEKNDFRKLYTDGDFNAYLDLPDFTKIEKLPEHHFFLGPVIWSAKTNAQDIITKKNIYISMGSTGNNKLVDPIISSVLKTDNFIVISGVSPEEQAKLLDKHPSLKGRSLIKSLLDPNSILPNCLLTICHGGSGTVYQSLSHGSPVLCFPTNPDQYLVSYAIQNKNLGRMIHQQKPSIKLILKSINECLNNSQIKQNTQSYIEKICRQNTQQKWLQFLNNFAPKQASPSIQIYKKKPLVQFSKLSSVSVAINQTLISIQKNELVKKAEPSGFTVKVANTLQEREAVFRLAYQVYLEKGFAKQNVNEWFIQNYDYDSETIILIAKDKNENIAGTVSLVFDGSSKLPAQNIYKEELGKLKDAGNKIAEISRLVISPDFRNSKEILVLLFNYLAIYLDQVKNYTCLAVEVNPRHKTYYQELLAFEELGNEKPCPSVQNAPATLLYLTVSKYRAEVMRHQNALILNKRIRSLYPYFIKPEQENLVAHYLKKQSKPMTAEEKVYFGFSESGITKAVYV